MSKDQRILYVGNLPRNLNENMIKEIVTLFTSYGKIDNVGFKDSRTYVFLTFHSESSVELVLQDKKKGDFILFGNILAVDRTKRKQPFLKKIHEENQQKARNELACGNRKERKNLSAHFFFSCFKEYSKVENIKLAEFRLKVKSGAIKLPDLMFWTVAEPQPMITWNNEIKQFELISTSVPKLDSLNGCESIDDNFIANPVDEMPDETDTYEPPTKLTRVFFQEGFSDKINKFKQHYQSTENLAYVLAQMTLRKPDMINYPVETVKGLQLETRGRKKILWVLVSFEGDWPEGEKEMWCSHSDVAASELMERYMEEEGLSWEIDFKGYRKREKKCFVDDASSDNNLTVDCDTNSTEIFKLFKKNIEKLRENL